MGQGGCPGCPWRSAGSSQSLLSLSGQSPEHAQNQQCQSDPRACDLTQEPRALVPPSVNKSALGYLALYPNSASAKYSVQVLESAF